VIIEPGGPRLTERLRLIPIGLDQVADLVAVHQDPWVAQWYAAEWSTATAEAFAEGCARLGGGRRGEMDRL